VKFEHKVRNSFSHISTVEIYKIMFVEGEILIACKQCNESSNPFSFSLTLGNLNIAARGKAWEILENL